MEISYPEGCFPDPFNYQKHKAHKTTCTFTANLRYGRKELSWRGCASSLSRIMLLKFFNEIYKIPQSFKSFRICKVLWYEFLDLNKYKEKTQNENKLYCQTQAQGPIQLYIRFCYYINKEWHREAGAQRHWKEQIMEPSHHQGMAISVLLDFRVFRDQCSGVHLSWAPCPCLHFQKYGKNESHAIVYLCYYW